MVALAPSAGFPGGAFAARGRREPAPYTANCLPVASEDGDFRVSIQECIDEGPRHLRLPAGDFIIRTAGYLGLRFYRNNFTMEGHPSGTRLEMWRPEGLFAQERLILVAASNVGIKRIRLNGGMGDQTCAEAKYDEYEDGTIKPGSQGQQSHIIFVAGTEESPTKNFSVRDVVFEESSGDAIFLYNVVQDTEISDLDISGFCRSGLTMNSYTNGGIRNIRVRRVTFTPQAVAQPSSRGIDIEPNGYLQTILIEDVRLTRFESGRVNDLVIDGMILEERNGIQPSGALVGGRGSGFVIRNSHFEESSDAINAPALGLSMSGGTLKDSTFVGGLKLNGAAGYYPEGIVIDNVASTGGIQGELGTSYSLDVAATGSVTVRNSTFEGRRGMFYFPSKVDAKLKLDNVHFSDGGTQYIDRSVFVRAPPFDGGFAMGGVYIKDSSGDDTMYVNSVNGVYPDMEVKVCNSNFTAQFPGNTIECE